MDTQPTSALTSALAQLKRDPRRPVRVRLEGMNIEIRAVESSESERKTAAEAFAAIGPWEGEPDEELREILARPVGRSAPRQVSGL